MKFTVSILGFALFLTIKSFAADELYTGAWWETVARTKGDNKSAGAVDITLFGAEGTNGGFEFKVTDLHVAVTWMGSWEQTKNTNIVGLVLTNSIGRWKATLNRSRGQLSGTWSTTESKGKFQTVRWPGRIGE